ncbi:uncharacterized protein DUF3786 [Desulfitobacterium sp. LBE]|uniref:DUF3786 domain-containing protein n=1 Tax=Desulfitobacterium hafniense TaxID=49338 RepID=A0A0W1JI88_DESHA|nr:MULTISPECIES: DUF3786 domain-containing protein [Desulfitobacterium]KTE91369.1 hypothetical protein AT727_22785 [Desulfitobacterium hafniense]TWH56583.1 uncharacterized protein DUF3786 [Desulfitobacterium sp. LBE]
MKESQKKYRDALEHAKQEFAKRSFAKILELSGAAPYDESSLVLLYGGEHYRVWYPEGEISPCEDITDQILILQYLTEVCGVQPTGRWISFRELPGGNNHYGAFKLEAMDPIAEHFGNSPEKFESICQMLKGKKLAMGDIAYAIEVLPKLELALILWLADDEWPAKANLLYDATASMHLNTEGLEVMAINLVEKMIAKAASL